MWLILCCLQLPVPVPSFLGWVPLVHGIGRDTGDVGLSWEPVELIVVGGGQLASHQMTSTVTF